MIRYDQKRIKWALFYRPLNKPLLGFVEETVVGHLDCSC